MSIKLHNACKVVKTVWWVNALVNLKEHKVPGGDDVKKTGSGQIMEGVKWQYKGFELNSTDHRGASEDPKQRCNKASSELAAL